MRPSPPPGPDPGPEAPPGPSAPAGPAGVLSPAAIDGAIADAAQALREADALLGSVQRISPIGIISPSAPRERGPARDEGGFVIDGMEDSCPSPLPPGGSPEAPLSSAPAADPLEARVASAVSQLFRAPLGPLFAQYAPAPPAPR